MSFQFKYLEDVALADVAFEVTADSWGALFDGAGAALTAVLVASDDLRGDSFRQVELSAPTIEELLYDWLCEFVYLKDTEGFLVKTPHANVFPGAVWRLSARLEGDTIDRVRHRLGQDVKAVTYHLFRVAEEAGTFRAKVVLDI
jgi:SHS2 domain-containing protein